MRYSVLQPAYVYGGPARSVPSLREAMGKRGMALVREQFAADVVAARMLEMFTSVPGRG
jgi:hypothetical protein